MSTTTKIKRASYTDEELIKILKDVGAELGRPPVSTDFRNVKGRPSFQIFINHFNSFVKARELAGYGIILKKYGKRYTREELIKHLKEIGLEKGRTPSITDFNNTNGKRPSYTAFKIEFGGMLEALKAADYDISQYANIKARKSEVGVLCSFAKTGAVDMSGKNFNSQFDGICPTGKKYDVKSSRLSNSGNYELSKWRFNFKHQSIIDYFFLMGYDNNHDKLIHTWMIPSNLVKNLTGIAIFDSEYNLLKWGKYEVKI
jgi:hypothetical protein